MTTFYFTYGSNHLDESGSSLGNSFTPVSVGDSDLNFENQYDPFTAAREKITAARDDKWSMQYATAEDAGVERHGLTERSLESVTFDRERMKREKIAEHMKAQRSRLESMRSMLDRSESILHRLPLSLVAKASVSMCGTLDFDHLSREESIEAMKALNGGRWQKKTNSSYETCLDYTAEIDGITVRLWAAAPPDSCRIVEVEEVIPEQRVIKRRLVCNEAAAA